MIRLRKILLCSYLYYFLFLSSFLFSFTVIHQQGKSSLEKSNTITGFIDSIKVKEDTLTLVIKQKEKVTARYYFKSDREKRLLIKNLELHDKVKLVGTLEKIKKEKENTLFHYEDYLHRQNIYYSLKIEEIYLVAKNGNLYYKIKNNFIKRCQNPYVKAFILGDTSKIKEEYLKCYRMLGISHLFAISGMHIGLISSFFLFLLKKVHIEENKRYLITTCFLFFYLIIIGLSPSILRAFLFFFFFSINKIYYFHIKSINIFLLVLSLTLLINPYYLFHIGFWYSYSISLALLITGEKLQSKNYFKSIFLVSVISFVVSIPTSIYFFNQINLLGIFYNLFYVPLVSFLLFPTAILTFFIPCFLPLLNFLVMILESSSFFLSKISNFLFILKSCNLFVYLFYILFIILFLGGILTNKRLYLIPIWVLLFLHYGYPVVDKSDYLYMIDVGQGDSILLHSNHKNILIDTGGIRRYGEKKKTSMVEKTTIPLLKKEGIKKLDYVILTHGDYDHLGEMLSLMEQFSVGQIYINEGYINFLERKIIQKGRNVKRLKQGDYLEVGDFRILSLNTDSKEENDSSIVLYVKIHDKKILLMGDASKKTEEYLLSKYSLGKVDILKCGHHGSKTSSSEKFLKEIKPNLALISAGVDNKFHHPSKEVVERLKKLKIKIYNTQELGNIKINL